MGEIYIAQEEKIRVLKLPYKLPKKLTELLEGFKWAIHSKKQSAVMIVDGRSGMGKTTLSFQISTWMWENFDLDHVFFTPEEFLIGLDRATKGDVLVFDEAMLISSRASLTAMNRMIIQAMSMIRSKNLFIIFNVNSIFDLDRNLALSRADLLLHCYGDSLTDKGKFLAFFKGGDGHDRIKTLYLNGKKFYSYGKPKSNFNTTFSAYFTLNEEEYEKKKDAGVKAFLTGTSKPVSNKDKQVRDRLMAYIYENKDKLGLTQEKLADIANLGNKTVWRALQNEKYGEKQGI